MDWFGRILNCGGLFFSQTNDFISQCRRERYCGLDRAKVKEYFTRDLPSLPRRLRAANSSELIAKRIKRKVLIGSDEILEGAVRIFRFPIYIAIAIILSVGFKIVQAYCIRMLIEALMQSDRPPIGDPNITATWAASLIIGLSVLNGGIQHASEYHERLKTIRAIGAISTNLMQRRLAMHDFEFEKLSPEFDFADTMSAILHCENVNSGWQCWFEAFLIVGSVYVFTGVDVGWPATVGTSILLVLSVPVTTMSESSLAFRKARGQSHKKERLKKTFFYLKEYTLVKLRAMEHSLSLFIGGERLIELRHALVGNRSFLLGAVPALSNALTATCVVFTIVTLTNHTPATPYNVFTTFYLFFVMNQSLVNLTSRYCRFCVARNLLKKVDRFITASEHSRIFTPPPIDPESSISVSGRFMWAERETRRHSLDGRRRSSTLAFELNAALQIQKGKFVAVVGAANSGKTSLLSAMIGEMPCSLQGGNSIIQGTTAVVPTWPWMHSASVRENIIIGKEYDQELYSMVSKACALENIPDREDAKYLNLRETTRVALARACYSNADVFILDDTLAGTERNEQRRIVRDCLVGLLAGKTRIIATDLAEPLLWADEIIVVQSRGRSSSLIRGTLEELQDMTVLPNHILDDLVVLRRPSLMDREIAANIESLDSWMAKKCVHKEDVIVGAPMPQGYDIQDRGDPESQALSSFASDGAEANPQTSFPGNTESISQGHSLVMPSSSNYETGDGPRTSDAVTWEDEGKRGTIDLQINCAPEGSNNSTEREAAARSSLVPEDAERREEDTYKQGSEDVFQPSTNQCAVEVTEDLSEVEAGINDPNQSVQETFSCSVRDAPRAFPIFQPTDTVPVPVVASNVQAESQPAVQPQRSRASSKITLDIQIDSVEPSVTLPVNALSMLDYYSRICNHEFSWIWTVLLLLVVEQLVIAAGEWWLCAWVGSVWDIGDGWYCGIIYIHIGVYLIFGWMGAWIISILGYNASYYTHSNMIASIMHAAAGTFERFGRMAVFDRFRKDLCYIDTELPVQYYYFTRYLMGVIYAVVLICLSIPYWIPIGLAFLVVAAILYNYVVYSFIHVTRLTDAALLPVQNIVKTTLAGATAIRVAGYTKEVNRSFQLRIDEYLKSLYAVEMIKSWLSTRCEFFTMLSTLSVVVLVITTRERLSPHYIALALFQSLKLPLLFHKALYAALNLNSQCVAGKRCQHINSLKRDSQPDPRGYNYRPISSGYIQAKKLTAHIPGSIKLLLRELSFDISSGCKVGIWGDGDEGAVLLSSFMRFGEETIPRNTLFLDGIDINSLDSDVLHTAITYIPKYPKMMVKSVRHNLDPTGKIADKDLWCVLQSAGINNFVADSGGLDSDIAVKSSPGVQRLLLMALALLRKSKVILIDGVVDDEHCEQQIELMVHETLRECTVLRTANTVELALQLDRVIVVRDGEIAEDGTPEELVRNPSSIFYGKTICEAEFTELQDQEMFSVPSPCRLEDRPPTPPSGDYVEAAEEDNPDESSMALSQRTVGMLLTEEDADDDNSSLSSTRGTIDAHHVYLGLFSAPNSRNMSEDEPNGQSSTYAELLRGSL